MKNKVTSWELSKRLDDLGFECEGHTGLWREYVNYHLPEYVSNYGETEIDFSKGYDRSIKAYDCHDLLTWLNYGKNPDVMGFKLYDSEDIDNEEVFFSVELYKEKYFRAYQPQEALGLAVVKILEEQDD